ncbi:hypothetical protein Mapa_015544 [Marchantia paleacea]|nr:hypothetical protein Mapa_015544 [Marchantia paleacea]
MKENFQTMTHKVRACSVTFHALFYIVLWIGDPVNGNHGAIAAGPHLENPSEANIGRNQSLPGLRASVSHIYHKDSPLRTVTCDDECIHELRINSTLRHMDLSTRSVKLPGWRGVVNSGYYVRSMAAEWYTTFIVGIARPDTRPQVVELALDTGSPFTWFQCQNCPTCFPQRIKLFSPRKSSTYRALNRNDQYCANVQRLRNIGTGATPNACWYRIAYADITSSAGMVAEEWFELQSANTDDDGQVLALGPMGFGCGFENEASVKSGAGGIMGLSNSRTGLSFPEQLEGTFGSMFGYCLTALNEPENSGYVFFGKASTPTGSYAWTPLLYPDTMYYYVDVVDMSVNDRLLSVPAGTFDRYSNGEGGVVVDSGSPYSYIPSAGYILLVAALRLVFDQLGSPYYPSPTSGVGPCWGSKSFDKDNFPFPRVAWHFRNGQTLALSIAGTYVLYRKRSKLVYVCVPFVEATDGPPTLSVIGGHSQINTYMFFDQPNQRLAWIYNSC